MELEQGFDIDVAKLEEQYLVKRLVVLVLNHHWKKINNLRQEYIRTREEELVQLGKGVFGLGKGLGGLVTG